MKNTSLKPVRFLKVSAFVVCIGAALALGGCATAGGPAQTPGEQVDDNNATSLVLAAPAADPVYKFDGIKVETFSGTVQLSGFVSTMDQKTRAGEIATKVTNGMKVNSVKSVVNNITVNTPAN